MEERDPLYRATADVTVATSRRSPMSVARKIMAALQALHAHEDA